MRFNNWSLNWSYWYLFIILVGFVVLVKSDNFSVKGNKIYFNGDQIKFKGIGLTCTEYLFKPHIDDQSPYPGYWGLNNCFGGVNMAGEVILNNEIQNVLNYLITNFNSNPDVDKVNFKSPYDQVITKTAPKSQPVVRIPIVGSIYLYDGDSDTGDHTMYTQLIDQLVGIFTAKKIAVILDLHWDCPDTSSLIGCMVGSLAEQPPLPQEYYGPLPGALSFWDIVSTKYSNNPFVIYELYSKPNISNFEVWYAGNSQYTGMRELYDKIRSNDQDALIIIGGKEQYALDPGSGLGFYLRYKRENGTYPHNVLWNILPFYGQGQGLERSLRSILRFSLALQTIGPVIFTQVQQGCCGTGQSCETTSSSCDDHIHGDNYVFNIINMAEQYDISWVGWGWRGTNNNTGYAPCHDGQTICALSDMRSEGGLLSNGSSGGPDWKKIWNTFVNTKNVNVLDKNPDAITKDANQVEGFLPRPCIVGDFNIGKTCGIDLAEDITDLSYATFGPQDLYRSILPGLPPRGNCSAQGCPGTPCTASTSCSF